MMEFFSVALVVLLIAISCRSIHSSTDRRRNRLAASSLMIGFGMVAVMINITVYSHGNQFKIALFCAQVIVTGAIAFNLIRRY